MSNALKCQWNVEMHERYTRDYERLCEIGQEILGATRQARWRRTGRAGGLFAAVEGVDRYERIYEGWLTFV